MPGIVFILAKGEFYIQLNPFTVNSKLTGKKFTRKGFL